MKTAQCDDCGKDAMRLYPIPGSPDPALRVCRECLREINQANAEVERLRSGSLTNACLGFE